MKDQTYLNEKWFYQLTSYEFEWFFFAIFGESLEQFNERSWNRY